MRKLLEIERLRGIAILAVVFIHATATATIAFPPSSLHFFYYNIINSLAQFAVPLFLFVSSVVLSYKLQGEKVSIPYYLKRIRSALVPYVLWSFAYTILKAYSNGSASFLNPLSFLKALYIGTTFYHLYFFLIILQLYICLPLTHLLIKKLSFIKVLTLVIFLQSIFYILNKHYLYALYPYPANLLASYLPVFLVGTWIGANYDAVLASVQKYWKILFSVALFFVVLFVIINIKLRLQEPLNLYLYYTIYHCFTLANATLFWVYASKYKLNFLSMLGKHSFGIFLLHPLFLIIWDRLGKIAPVYYDIMVGGSFLFAVIVPYYLSMFLSQNPKISRFLFAR